LTIASGMRPRRLRVPTALQDGGTGSRTREEAVAVLGVPSLDGDNVFTGTQNTFPDIRAGTVYSTGTMQADGTVTFTNGLMTLGTDTLTHSNGFAALTLPAAVGTLALTGDPLQCPYKAQGSVYAASSSDCVINCTGTWTLTLPTAVGVSGRFYYIKNSGAGVITVACTGGQTIDGAATQAVIAGASLTVCSDGANWLIL